jgi:hypothetical protein
MGNSKNTKVFMLLAMVGMMLLTVQVQDLSGIPDVVKMKQEQTDQTVAPSPKDARVPQESLEFASMGMNLKNITAAALGEEQKRPTFYLHIGPPKTSTTTIQAHLTAWRHDLEKDDVIYLGRYFDRGGRFFTDPRTSQVVRAVTNMGCYFQGYEAAAWLAAPNASHGDSTGMYPECFVEMLKDMGDFFQKHPTSHVILSDEVLMAKSKLLDRLSIFGDFLQHTLFQNYTLHIVSSYRRLEDWYPSARKQINLRSQKRNKWQGYVWPLFPNVLGLARHHTHRIMPTPWEIIWALQHYNQNGKHLHFHVYNIHDDSESIMATWFCDILNATHTCRKARQQNDSDLKLNSDHQRNIDLMYDEVVSWATHKNVLDKNKVRRKQAIQQAMAHDLLNNRTFRDLPLACPSKEQYEEYFNISRYVEGRAIPEFAAVSQSLHHEQFDKSVYSNKYCSVNTTAILQDPYWQRFFETNI